MKKLSYLWHAFKQPLNLLLLAGGFTAGLLIPNAIYWAAFLGLEVFTLITYSSNKKFQMVVRSKESKEEDRYQFQKLKSIIRNSNMKSGKELSDIENQIRKIKRNYRLQWKGNSHTESFENALGSIDELYEQYIRLFANLIRVGQLEKNVDVSQVQTQIKSLKEKLADAKPELKQVLEKQLDMMEKRIAKTSSFKDNKDLFSAQLDVVKETLNYLHDESIHIKEPKDITIYVDKTLDRMGSTKDTLIEIEQFEDISEAQFENIKMH